MNALAGFPQINQASQIQSLTSQPVQTPTGQEKNVQQAFQDFVAGTFYKQMLKALRQTQKPSAYFDGGQAEKIFQGQMDQQMAENLARDHGAAFADPLFQTFAIQIHASGLADSTAPSEPPQQTNLADQTPQTNSRE